MILQRAQLMELLDHDESAYMLVLRSFIDSSEEIVAELRKNFAAQQMTDIKNLTHKLKSAARGVGAMELGDACESIEARATEGNLSAVKTELPILYALCDEVIAHIKLLDTRK